MSSLTPVDVVQSFIGAWPQGLESLRQSFADWLAEDVLYENVGLTRTTTRADAIALIETFAPGLDNIAVDMLAIAQDGERVFT
ncbi:hypothetical protein [Pseudomonas aeruginosa]|uniref:hypothetical protein n=1 Tax=Pseudomonas aeruginosa TaxID=287 RepID=UPI003D2B090A